MSAVHPQEKRLAEAVTALIAAIHEEIPAAAMRSLTPYDDEDFTLEVRIPPGMDLDTALDLCLRHALAVEDQFGFLIVTRVKPAVAEATT